MRPSVFASLVLAFGVCLPLDGRTQIHYVSHDGENIYPYTSPETGAHRIQDAVDAAEYGDIVDVAPGEYVEQVTLKDGIILWGWGADATVIRQPEGAAYAVTGAEDIQIRELSVLAPRGKPDDGSPRWPPGILLGSHGNQLVADCVLSGNFMSAVQCDGRSPGLPIIIKRTVIEGVPARFGVGISLWHSWCVIDQCVFRDCELGVWAESADVSIARSTFQRSGVRVWGARAQIYQCAFLGLGIEGEGSDLLVCNSLIWGDWAGIAGSLHTNIAVLNCTITGNGVGIFCWETDLWAENCIIWGNAPSDLPGLGAGIDSEPERTTVRYSDVQAPFPDANAGALPGVWPGNGNIAADPLFRDAQGLHFRLMAGSPCIDACFPYWSRLGERYPSAPELSAPFADLDGGARRLYGGRLYDPSLPPFIDMGAYEFWLSRVEPGEAGAMTLTWSSVSDRSYSVYYSDDLLTWLLAAGGLPSAGDSTTSWTDTGVSGTGIPAGFVGKRFYRVVALP